MVDCNECGLDLRLGNVEQGELVRCGDCQSEFEVTATNPVVLAPAPEEQEDWGE